MVPETPPRLPWTRARPVRAPFVPIAGLLAITALLLAPAAPPTAPRAGGPTIGSAHGGPGGNGSGAMARSFASGPLAPGNSPRSLATPLPEPHLARALPPLHLPRGGAVPVPALRARLAASMPVSVASHPTLAPSDVALSGNQSLVISANTTVGNISLQDQAILVVQSPTIRPTLTVDGNIQLSGDAIFYVNSSDLRINESYNVQLRILTSGRAVFAVAYANVTTNGFQWGGAFEGSSNVTVVASLFCYPSGWIDTTLIQNASLTVALSYYLSDVILFDNPVAPSTARFHATDSAGFNVWLNFKLGSRANLSLPGLSGWRNWTFPGGAPVSGTNYTVNITYSFVQVFAVMLWQGANLTLRDSADVAVSLNLEFGAVTLDGLQETHYGAFGLYGSSLALTLSNTTIFTWNVYPFAGSAAIHGGQIGEVQVYGSASATIDGANLTGHGGYYGNQGNGTFGIANSTIHGEFVATSGRSELDRCTVDPPYASRVLAAATGRIGTLDTTLSASDQYEVQDAGRIDVAYSVTASLVPVPPSPERVVMELNDTTNGSVLGTGPADAFGVWTVAAPAETILASGTARPGFLLLASNGSWAARAGLGIVTQPEPVTMTLVPIVARTYPPGGAFDVPTTSPYLSILFNFAMRPGVTLAELRTAPAITYDARWTPSDDDLTLSLPAGLDPNVTYHVTLAAGATTQDGLVLSVPYPFNFSTFDPSLPRIPSVTSTDPANSALEIPVTTTVRVDFSVPMDPATLSPAFRIVPSNISGDVRTGSTFLVWTPWRDLTPGTLYRVTITTNATSATGGRLPTPYSFSFRTAGSPPSGPAPPPPPPSKNPTSNPIGPAALGVGGAVLVAGIAGFALLQRARRRRSPPPAPGTTDGPSGPG